MQLFGYILTFDEKYILIFGGDIQNIQSDTIYILDFENETFNKSAIKCPLTDAFVACIALENINKSVVNGYIKEYIGIGLQMVPQDIIQLIWNWCSNSVVHLFDSSKRHWKIDVDKILTST